MKPTPTYVELYSATLKAPREGLKLDHMKKIRVSKLRAKLLSLARMVQWWPWRRRDKERDSEDMHRQMLARSARIEEHIDLSAYGVRAVRMGAVKMWGTDGAVELHMDPETALFEIGFGVIITIDGVVFVEPWG